MKIIVTVRDLFDKGVWMEYCDITGTSEWAVKEGRMNSDDEIELTDEQARKLRFIPEEDY